MFRPHKAKWTMSLIALGATLAAATPVLPSPKGDYLRFCSLCHGFDGTGKGALADALKKPPADLTLLTRRQGGKFPAEYVKEVIIEGGGIIGHGSSHARAVANALELARELVARDVVGALRAAVGRP